MRSLEKTWNCASREALYAAISASASSLAFFSRSTFSARRARAQTIASPERRRVSEDVRWWRGRGTRHSGGRTILGLLHDLRGLVLGVQQLLDAQQVAFNHASVGKTVPVLFERTGRKAGQLVGRSPWLQAVHVEADVAMMGNLTDVTLVEAKANSLAGVLQAAEPAGKVA